MVIRRRSWAWWAAVWVGVCVGYAVLAHLSQRTASLPNGVPAAWPPAGLALAAVLRFGYRVWPAVIVGALIGIDPDPRPDTTWGLVALTLAISGATTLQVLLGAWALRRYGGAARPFSRLRYVVVFVGVTALLSSMFCATCCTLALTLLGLSSWPAFLETWVTWTLGEAVGILVFAPVFVVWRRLPRTRLPAVWVLEFAAVVGVLLAVGYFGVRGEPVGFLVIPTLVWATFRLGLHGATAALAALFVGVVSLVVGLAEVGALVADTLNKALLISQAAMGVTAVTPLVLHAVLAERKSASARLAGSSAVRARLQNELGLAREVQQGLLPKEPPATEAFDIAAWSRPADDTGGDYYDWQATGDGRWVVTLADVTGHGIGPALIAAQCRAYARAGFARGGEGLGETLTRVNRLLADDLGSGRFITFVAARLDPQDASIDLLSCGHGPLLRYVAATGEVEAMDADVPPLGVLPELTFDGRRRVELAPGDALVLVTDGFFEWMNEAGEEFGVARLCAATAEAAGMSGASAESVIQRVRRRLAAFVRGTRQLDDLTAVVVRRPG